MLASHEPESPLLHRGSDFGGTRVAERLRQRGKLLGVQFPLEPNIRHPLCQIADGKLLPVVAELLAVLPIGSGSGWLRAFWMHAPNDNLDGRRPADLMGTKPDLVVAAAAQVEQPSAYFGWR
jgi:hypothetical protein